MKERSQEDRSCRLVWVLDDLHHHSPQTEVKPNYSRLSVSSTGGLCNGFGGSIAIILSGIPPGIVVIILIIIPVAIGVFQLLSLSRRGRNLTALCRCSLLVSEAKDRAYCTPDECRSCSSEYPPP